MRRIHRGPAKTPDDHDPWIKKPLVFIAAENTHLDKLVAQQCRVSRKVARQWIMAGHVRIHGESVRILLKPVKKGTPVEIEKIPQPNAAQPIPTLTLLYKDDVMIVVCKPARLLSAPDRSAAPSVLSEIKRHLSHAETQKPLHLVHRLDAGTSGVMVLARTSEAANQLDASFRNSRVGKVYVALVEGEVARPFHVSEPIQKITGNRHGVDANGKRAETGFRSLEHSARASLLLALPKTGRTHQIRVHLAYVGHPIVGDRLYGGPGYTPIEPMRPVIRPMLHAWGLHIPHPKTQAMMHFHAPCPPDFMEATKAFGLETQALTVSVPPAPE